MCMGDRRGSLDLSQPRLCPLFDKIYQDQISCDMAKSELVEAIVGNNTFWKDLQTEVSVFCPA